MTPRRSTSRPDGVARLEDVSGGGALDDRAADHLERSLRPLLDAALAAGEELEERVAPAHLRALQALEVTGPAQVSALAEAMSLLPSTASRLSDRLAAAGLITRSVSPTNRRATLLDLTPSGQAVLDELAEARRTRIAAVLALMDDEAREALLRGVAAFADAAGGLDRAEPSRREG